MRKKKIKWATKLPIKRTAMGKRREREKSPNFGLCAGPKKKKSCLITVITSNWQTFKSWALEILFLAISMLTGRKNGSKRIWSKMQSFPKQDRKGSRKLGLSQKFIKLFWQVLIAYKNLWGHEVAIVSLENSRALFSFTSKFSGVTIITKSWE